MSTIPKHVIFGDQAAKARVLRFDHVLTYGGNPLSMAAAVAALDILQRENLVERASERGAYLFRKAKALEAHPIVGDIRGKGLMMGIEFVQDKETMEPFPPERRMYKQGVATALSRGLIVYPGAGAIDGRRGDHITICPPLTVSEEEIDELIEILDATFKEVGAGLGG